MSAPAHAIDATAAGAVVASVTGMLPPMLSMGAATLACAWYAVQLYESQTVQKFLTSTRPSFLVRAAQWVLNNKPYIIALIASATAALQASGRPVPTWLYVAYAALGGAALHSSYKSGTSDPVTVTKPPSEEKP